MKDSVLPRIIRSIVDVADPDFIIQIGSRVTEPARNDSDYDICVLKSGIHNRRTVSGQLNQNLWDVGAPVDILVETPESFKNV